VFSTEDKAASLTAIAKKAKLKALSSQFIGTVAGNGRADQLPAIINAFEKMVALRKGAEVAKVTSAKKLTAAQVASLKTNLKKSLGRPVEVTLNPQRSIEVIQWIFVLRKFPAS